MGTESNAPAWEPRPVPLRGTGHRLAGGVPIPVAPHHPDYKVPHFSRDHAAAYVGLPWHRQSELDQIPHGQTNALHFCFAQSDLNEVKATLKPEPPRKRRNATRTTADLACQTARESLTGRALDRRMPKASNSIVKNRMVRLINRQPVDMSNAAPGAQAATSRATVGARSQGANA